MLINYCTGQEADTEKLDYIFRTRRKEIVFTSSLALVTEGLSLESKDIEDNIHYVLARKMKCEVILTNNLSDFSKFKAVKRISPQMSLSAVKRVIK